MPIGKHIILLVILSLAFSLKAVSTEIYLQENGLPVKTDSVSAKKQLVKQVATKLQKVVPANKLVAILFAVFTGPLGGHRIYLGTSVQVPLIYTVTIGGGFGVLPLADIIAIIITPDLNDYINNPHVLMWIKDNDE